MKPGDIALLALMLCTGGLLVATLRTALAGRPWQNLWLCSLAAVAVCWCVAISLMFSAR